MPPSIIKSYLLPPLWLPRSAAQSGENVMEQEEVKLSERELRIAEHAAKLAVEQMETRFYASVGKNVVTRGLVWLGMVVVAFSVGKGYIKLP